MIKSGLAAVAAFLCATAVVAAEPETEGPKEEKKVCRSERLTGSLTKVRRICMTQAEWDALSRQTKTDIDDMQRNGGSIPRAASGSGMTAGSQ